MGEHTIKRHEANWFRGVAFKMGIPHFWLDDAAQEAMIQCWRYPYMNEAVAARSAIINFWRDQCKGRPPLASLSEPLLHDEQITLGDVLPDPRTQGEWREDWLDLQSAIPALKPYERAALEAMLRGGESGKTGGVVRTNTYRARQHLRSVMHRD